MILDQISKKDKVLILGFAREGQSTKNFLQQRYPDLRIDTADQKDGPDYLKNLPNYKIIIKTPGISPHKPEIEAAKKAGVIFTSHMQIFLDVCPSKNTIGVTGTKGKSTTTSLIYAVLKSNNLPCVLVGNIGQSALDFLSEITPDTWVVMELSSYQLLDLSVSPHLAVLQAIFPDHLDYHTDFNEYQKAKANIFKFQKPGDYLIYNSGNPNTQQLVTQFPNSHKLLPFDLSDFDPNIITKLLGDHNKLNIIPSLIISRLLKLPKKLTYQAIEDFHPLDTRLELVTTKNGIRFYADTLATIPEATIAAIDALHPNVETLIAGGHERKQNYLELAKKILDSKIKTLILFPATGPRIAAEIKHLTSNPSPEIRRGESKGVRFYHTDNMKEAVRFALDHTASGKICLLSPAAPSFTLFKDYKDEYNQYKQAIAST